MKRFSPFKFVSSLIVFLLLVSLFSYYSADAQSKRTYYVHRTSKLYASASSGNFIRYVPVNAQLTTASKKSSKRYRVTYNGQTGYVYRVNLSARRTTVTRYIAKTSYLYTSRDASKSRIQKIAVDKSLTTDSNLNSTMYHVNYKGKRGYVYRVNLSTGKTPITKFVAKTSRIYKNYSHTKRYATTIPVQTQLTTTSPQSNRLFWISYRGIHGYVYASNLGSNQQYYNNTIPSGATGYMSAGGNHGIWSKPYGLYGASDIGKAADYVNVPLSIKQESKVGSTVWIQIAYNGRILGWVHKDIVQDVSPHLSFARVLNVSGRIYNAPNGNNTSNLTLLPYAQLKLKIDEISNDGQWAHIRKFTAGTNLGWVHASDLKITEAIDDSGNGKLINVHYGVSITDSEGAVFDSSIKFQGYLNQYLNGGNLAVIKEQLIGNEEMYNLSQNGQSIGWVRSNTIRIDKPVLGYSYYSNTSDSDPLIYNGNSDGNAPDLSSNLGHLSQYSNRMLEVIATDENKEYSLVKYNDWYDTDGNDIDLGWVKSDNLSTVSELTDDFGSMIELKFDGLNRNQQGLAYNDNKKIYYVGYDTGNGSGEIVPFAYKNGILEPSPDGLPTLPGSFGHTCALSYYDGKLYEVSSAGEKPVLYTIDASTMKLIRPAADSGAKITSDGYGVILDTNYISMMAVKDSNTLIFLTQSNGNDAYYYYQINPAKKIKEIDKSSAMGVVQGLQYDPDHQMLYYLANNYLVVMDDSKDLSIVKRYHFSFPGSEQESEGLTLANGQLTIGSGTTRNIYQLSNPIK